MKNLTRYRRTNDSKTWHIAILFVALSMLLGAPAAQAELVAQWKATNYDPATGVWTNTGSGVDATQTDPLVRPTLVTEATPNGSPAVRFGSDQFLDTGIPVGNIPNGFTVFAFLRPDNPGNVGPRGIASGAADGGFLYRLLPNTRVPSVGRISLQLVGSGTTGVPVGDFSSINVAISSALGTAFRFNGSDDGTNVCTGGSCSGFTPILRIGRFIEGDIAEIRIYDTELSLAEIEAVEAEMDACHKAVSVPIRSTWSLTLLAGLLLVVTRFGNAISVRT